MQVLPGKSGAVRCPTAVEPAMAAAYAAIEKAGLAHVARQARLSADRRLSQLRELASRPDRPLADGMAGGRGVFAQLESAEHFIGLRARALMMARVHQLDGLRASALTELSRAVTLRRHALARTLRPSKSRSQTSMKTDQLRAVFGKLTDLAFDVARLDATAAQSPAGEPARLLRERQLAGLMEGLRDDFSRVARLLGLAIVPDLPEALAPDRKKYDGSI